MKKIWAALGAVCLLSACVGPTPYQPRSEKYGYADQQLDQTHYRVSFTGNPETARDVVENYLLYRAAQLTLANGNQWFTIVDHDTDKDTSYSGFADPGAGVGPAFAGGYGYPGWYGGGTVIDETPTNQYRADLTMAVSGGAKPVDKNTYDASDVVRRLEGLVVLPGKE